MWTEQINEAFWSLITANAVLVLVFLLFIALCVKLVKLVGK